MIDGIRMLSRGRGGKSGGGAFRVEGRRERPPVRVGEGGLEAKGVE